jgi:hypothetical protein
VVRKTACRIAVSATNGRGRRHIRPARRPCHFVAEEIRRRYAHAGIANAECRAAKNARESALQLFRSGYRAPWLWWLRRRMCALKEQDFGRCNGAKWRGPAIAFRGDGASTHAGITQGVVALDA